MAGGAGSVKGRRTSADGPASLIENSLRAADNSLDCGLGKSHLNPTFQSGNFCRRERFVGRHLQRPLRWTAWISKLSFGD